MKNIVIVIPTDGEATGLIERGLEVVVCGVGMAQCAAVTARVLAEKEPDLVILAGIAGAYTNEVAVGETVIVRSERVGDLMPRYQQTYLSCGPMPDGYKIVHSTTVNTPGCAGVEGDDVYAEIENMEGAAFFAVCQQFDVQALEIRTISNRVGEPITSENLKLAVARLSEDVARIFELLCV